MQYYGPGAGMPSPIEGLLQNGYAFLQMGNFPAASDCFSRAINMDVTNVHAQNGLILAELRMPSMAALESSTVFFHNTNAYKFIVANCDDARRAQLTALLEKIKANTKAALEQAKNARAFANVKALALSLLSIDPKNKELGKTALLAALNVQSIDELEKSKKRLDSVPEYKQLIGCFSADEASRLEEINKKNKARKKKKGFIVLGCVFVLLAAIIAGVLIYVNSDKYKYETRDISGGVEIVSYRGKDSSINIPSKIGGKNVVSIGENAFAGKNITSVVIPEGVETIRESAFLNCTSLTSVTLPSTLKRIEAEAFSYTGLEAVYIPDGTEFIGEYAFYVCESLETVYIPSSVETVEYYAFCNGDAGVKIYVQHESKPYTWNSRWCGTVEETSIFWGIDNFGETDGFSWTYDEEADGVIIFNYDGNESELTIPATLDGKKVVGIAREAIYNNDNLVKLTIEDGIEFIGELAFYDCDNLNIVVIPRSVISIGYRAFYYGNDMTIFCEADEMPSGWNDEWNGSNKVVLSCSSIDTIDGYTFKFDENLNATITGYTGTAPSEFEIPSSLGQYTVVGIGKEAFYDFDSVQRLIIPSTIVSIDTKAFYDCDNLQSAVVPSSVAVMGEFVFYYGNGLVIYCEAEGKPDGWASNWCNDSVVRWGAIGEDTYGDYSYSYDANGNATILSCTSQIYGEYEIPSTINGYTVVAIGDRAFSYQESITLLTIPDTVKRIGREAFYACYDLEQVTIPGSVEVMDENVFSYCGELSIYCQMTKKPDSWALNWYEKGEAFIYWNYAGEETIGNYTFYYDADGNATILGYNGGDYNLEIPSKLGDYTVVRIAEYAFYDLYYTRTVTVPKTVIEIGDYAFYECDNLEKVYLLGNIEVMGELVFYYGNGLRICCADLAPTSNWCESWVGSGIPVYWGYAGELTIGDYYFYYDINGNATILSYNGSSNVVMIPETVGDYYVIRIGAEAFYNIDAMEYVEIPDTVVEINDRAFYDCDSLRIATIPSSVEKMGEHVFYYGNNLYVYCEAEGESSDWEYNWCGYNVTYVFGNTRIVISEIAVLDIKDDGTAEFHQLIGSGVNGYMLKIPSEIRGYRVTSIGDMACSGFNGIEMVEIPDTVVEIGSRAFYDCGSLKWAYVPQSVEIMGSEVFYYGDYATIYCEASQKPDGWDEYWYGYKASPSWSADKYVISGDYAIKVSSDSTASIIHYMGNTNFLQIPSEIEGYTVTAILNGAFDNWYSLYGVLIPDTVTYIEQGAFYGCEYLRFVFIPGSVEVVEDYAFYYGSSLRLYCEASSKPSAWGSAWYGRSSNVINWDVTLERDSSKFTYRILEGEAIITGYEGTAKFIYIPSEIDGYTVVGIDDGAFYYESSICVLVISNTVEWIGEGAFYSCDRLREVYIPDSVVEIGRYAFHNGTSLRINCEVNDTPYAWDYNWYYSATIYWGVRSKNF